MVPEDSKDRGVSIINIQAPHEDVTICFTFIRCNLGHEIFVGVPQIFFLFLLFMQAGCNQLLEKESFVPSQTYETHRTLCKRPVGLKVCAPRTAKGRFTHSMPCPCRVHAVPLPCSAVNSHMPCRATALLRQSRLLRESPRGSRKYPNC
jgi:hypothetical protein